MRIIRITVILALLLLLPFAGAQGQQKDRLLQFLKKELEYNTGELRKQELPPYYTSFRVEDEKTVNITSSFGAIMDSNDRHQRRLIPQIRLGDTLLDNFKYNHMGSAPFTDGIYSTALLPLNNDHEAAARQTIWDEIIKRYDFARDAYEKTKIRASVSVADEDKASCFSAVPVERYYEEPLPSAKLELDRKAWEQRLNEISMVFKSSPLIMNGTAALNFRILRLYFLDSEGTEVVQNRIYARIIVSASVKADDGMDIPLNLSYFAYDPTNLPTNDFIVADTREMVGRLLRLREAPVADPYTGPALLSGSASGVFFHEIFGHRLEGHRLKSGGQTFKKMVGESVLPESFYVYGDPTLESYAGEELNGSYLYDDEGVKAQRVEIVRDGILRGFLMSRVPIDGFPRSNGHGRATGGADPVSRQSNLIVETSSPYAEAELRQMLINEAKQQDKEYGYFFKEVTSGFTFTGEGGSLNSFNVTPVEVYRVFIDGRPDQLVRGVDMIGTPLSMFSNITAAGDRPGIFTGMCGAESGWIPVTAISPMIMVNKVETQRRQKSNALPPVLPAPQVEGTCHTSKIDMI